MAEIPRKAKDAIALFERTGRSPDGDFGPKRGNAQRASPVEHTSLPTEAERIQNGLPRSKNAGLTREPQLPISDYRPQPKRTAEPYADVNDFRARPKAVKSNPKIGLDNGSSANSKTGNKTDQVPTQTNSSKISEKTVGQQGHGKTVTSSPNVPGNDFKNDLARLLSSPNPATRLASPTGPISSTHPKGKLPVGTTTPRSTKPDSPSIPKGVTTVSDDKPLAQVTRAKRQPTNGAGGSTSNTPNLPKNKGQILFHADSDGKSNSHQSSTHTTKEGSHNNISGQKSPAYNPAVATKSYTLPHPTIPKPGGNLKAMDQNEPGSGMRANWKIDSTQANHSAQIVSANGKKYRLRPLPTADPQASPRKPRRPPSVDLTQFIHHASDFNETEPKAVRSVPLPPPIHRETQASSTDRAVSLISEWTEEDETWEVRPDLNADDDDEYVNVRRNGEKQIEWHSTIGEEESESFKEIERLEEYLEMVDASDESDYETLD